MKKTWWTIIHATNHNEKSFKRKRTSRGRIWKKNMYLWIGSFWHGDFEWFELNFYYAFILSCVYIGSIDNYLFLFLQHDSFISFVTLYVCLHFNMFITRLIRKSDNSHCTNEWQSDIQYTLHEIRLFFLSISFSLLFYFHLIVFFFFFFFLFYFHFHFLIENKKTNNNYTPSNGKWAKNQRF